MTNRRAISLTARREISERWRSRAFKASVAIQLLVVIAVVVVSAISGGDDGETYDVGAVGADSERLVDEISDRSVDGVTVNAEDPASAGDARSQVADGDLDAALVDGVLVTSSSTDAELEALIQEASSRAKAAAALERQGLGAKDVQEALNPPPLETDEVGSDSGGEGIAFVGSLLLYLGILGFGYLVTSAVVEEKTTRVVELVLSTIRATQLLAGKVIGIGLLGIGQLIATAVVGIGGALASGQIDLPSTTGQTLALVVIYFVLGYALYACAFAAAGAIVSRQEDVGSVTAPLTIVLVAGYLASFSVSDDPGGTLAVVCTYLPPVAPLVVPARAAVGELPLGELIASIALMLVAIAALIWLAGRVYERAILHSGASMKLTEGLKLVRSKRA